MKIDPGNFSTDKIDLVPVRAQGYLCDHGHYHLAYFVPDLVEATDGDDEGLMIADAWFSLS